MAAGDFGFLTFSQAFDGPDRYTDVSFLLTIPYRHRKRAWVKGRAYPFPINLETVNAFFDEQLTVDNIATFPKAKAAPFYTDSPANFEDAALASLGQELYEGFFKGYTNKQWGRDPKDIPAWSFVGCPFISRKIPTYSTTNGMPREGYTKLVEKILAVVLDFDFRSWPRLLNTYGSN